MELSAVLAQLETAVVGETQPDLTLMLDVPAVLGLERAAGRGGPARFEAKGLAFHERLRSGFLALAEVDPQRRRVVDARRGVDDVAAAVWALVEPLVGAPA